MVQNSMYDMHRLFFMQHGVGVNKNDGYYQRGKSYSLSKKLLVPATYLEAKEKFINAGLGFDAMSLKLLVNAVLVGIMWKN